MDQNVSSVIPRSIGTHSGSFHADEITACALLVFFRLADKNKIYRTRDPKSLGECEYVCDVGGKYDPCKKLFDHHQLDYSGLKSSAGMILDYLFDTGVIDSDIHALFLDKLVIGVDDHDNGRAQLRRGYASFSHIISNFVPIRYDSSAEQQDAAFSKALEFVLEHFERLYKRYQYHNECRAIVVDAMKAGGVLLEFTEAVPWLESFFALDGETHEAKFVLMPAGNHWKLRGIPPTYDRRMEVRHPFPKEWAGLLESELKALTRIDGAIFCHKGRFISVWENKQDALAALDLVLNMDA